MRLSPAHHPELAKRSLDQTHFLRYFPEVAVADRVGAGTPRVCTLLHPGAHVLSSPTGTTPSSLLAARLRSRWEALMGDL